MQQLSQIVKNKIMGYSKTQSSKRKNTPCWTGYKRKPGTKRYAKGSCKKK